MPFFEQYATSLGLVAAFMTSLTGLAGLAIYRGKKEVKDAQGPSGEALMKSALDANTQALHEHGLMFRQVIQAVNDMNQNLRDIEREIMRQKH